MNKHLAASGEEKLPLGGVSECNTVYMYVHTGTHVSAVSGGGGYSY